MACNKKQFYLIKYDRFQSDILPVSSLMLHAIGVLQYRSRIDNCLFACSTFLADKTNPSIHQFRINTRETCLLHFRHQTEIYHRRRDIFILCDCPLAPLCGDVLLFFFFSSQEKEKKKKRRRPSNDVPDGAYRFFFFSFPEPPHRLSSFYTFFARKEEEEEKKIRWKGERKNFCLAGQKKKNVFILQWLLLLAVLSVNR